MTAPHLPAGTPTPPSFRGCAPLNISAGVCDGHEIVLLSVELWDGFSDLRFARIDHAQTMRLTRRVPPAANWQIRCNGTPVTVFDAVGRGDRSFSNGEVRLLPPLSNGDMLEITVALYEWAPPLTATVPIHVQNLPG